MRVIDDTYNANQSSICAAIDLLKSFDGRKVLVLGDIAELGEWAEQSHRDVGAYAAGKVDALYAVGPHMAHAVSVFGPGARHFATQAELIQALTAAEHDKHTT
ncbi:glutamate ligase domain-containing protein, partial [Klebsiella quasipneumoniae]